MGTSSERVFNGSGKGYLPAGTMGNRTHILSERLKAGTEFKRLKKGHRPAPMPPTWTHFLSYKPRLTSSPETGARISNSEVAVACLSEPPIRREKKPMVACPFINIAQPKSTECIHRDTPVQRLWLGPRPRGLGNLPHFFLRELL